MLQLDLTDTITRIDATDIIDITDNIDEKIRPSMTLRQ